MTCIVGIETAFGTALGADNLGSNTWVGEDMDREKVITNGPLLIAGTGSYRMIDLAEYVLVPPPHHPPEMSNRKYLVSSLIPAWIEVLENGKALDSSGGDSASGQPGGLLLAYQGLLYEIQADFSILRAREIGDTGMRIMTGGSGGEHAYTLLRQSIEDSPRQAAKNVAATAERRARASIERTIRAVSDRVVSVNGRITIKWQAK